jgi:hypothetical protein
MNALVKRRYQMVIQFASTFLGKPADVRAFEDRLVKALPRTCKVDGHEVGSRTTSFFVRTTSPLAAHRVFRKRIATRMLERNVRVAFRMLPGSQWMNLWPFRDSRPFALVYERDRDPFNATSKREIPKRGKPGESKFATPARKEW